MSFGEHTNLQQDAAADGDANVQFLVILQVKLRLVKLVLELVRVGIPALV